MAKSSHFDIPEGAISQVKIIDTTSRMFNLPTTLAFKPLVNGYDFIEAGPSWSFLIESPSGKKVLFDLSIPKDPMSNIPPGIAKIIRERISGIENKRDVVEILQGHGVSVADIDSVVWSHWHWDHIGNIANFPPSTDLVVGPGFKDAFLPGYPINEKSPISESDVKGRTVIEIDFDKPGVVQFGQLKAVDYFGDGSFYLLNTPGHAIGHLAGLARTTTDPDTFILMGGDVCHHVGELRPSEHSPIPAEISPHPWLAQSQKPCPGRFVEEIQLSRGRQVHEPIFDPATGDSTVVASETIQMVQEADGRKDVLFIFAHDDSILDIVDFFPLSANDWKQKGWGEKHLWKFVQDFRNAMDID